MKKYSKFMLTVSLLAAASIGMASAAPVTIRITGSSAYRAAVTNAILHLLDSSKGIQAVFQGSSTTTLGGSNQQIIHGFLLNAVSGTGETSYSAGQEVYFKTSWTGSLSGLIALTTNADTAQPFLSTSNINTSDAGQNASAGSGASSAAANGPQGGEVQTSPTLDAAQIADYAMSDVFASSTAYNSSNLVSAKTSLTGAANGGAPPGVVGVVPFTFVAGVDMPASVTNINSIQVQQLLQGGLKLSQLTGVSTDSSTNVLAVGRDSDSGTRFTAFAESAFTLIGLTNPDPTQYIVNETGSAATSIEPYPAETLFGQSYDAGTQGYSSGGNLATALKATGTTSAADNPGQLVAYLGESDATNAVGGGAHVLSYNGVAYGTQTGTSLTFNRTLIDEGVYTFWGYEHEYYLKGNADAAIADAVAKQVASTDAAVTGELLANMHVSRGQEGAPIGHN